jgi:uncharacterized protein YbgA (DUF1722 family)/uncharacterized protein YbbK (DUF523 family)
MRDWRAGPALVTVPPVKERGTPKSRGGGRPAADPLADAVALDRPLRVGISSCLLGNEVRFDGGHKRDRFLTDVLGPHVEWVPVCPELEAGMGVPREAVRLVGEPGSPRMMGVRSGADHTSVMRRFAASRVRALAALDLAGFVLKKDSPSCGMERVPVHRPGGGVPSRAGRGLFAATLIAALPLLPVEEEGRLNDPVLRENFIERLFCYRRWRDLATTRGAPGALVRFHTVHKLTLLAHSPRHYAALGRLVGERSSVSPAAVAARYGALFMEALAVQATPRKHTNVLQHIAGYCRAHLSPPARHELSAVIQDYGRGLVPLIVPITLLKHHVEQHDIAYIKDQLYLELHPKELMLRNHV